MTLGITTTVNIEGAVGSDRPSIFVVDAHELIATSLAMALRQAGFDRVSAVDPDALTRGEETDLSLALGDIALVGLLFGDGRTTLPLIRPLVERGCRVIVMAADQALPLPLTAWSAGRKRCSTRPCPSSAWSEHFAGSARVKAP